MSGDKILEQTVCVVLAGGRGQRLGGRDKALIPFLEGCLLSRIQSRVTAPVAEVVLSANGDPGRFVGFGWRVLPDLRPGHLGPLAGIEAALVDDGRREWVLSVSVDLPFLPFDWMKRLAEASGDARQPVVASSNGRLHPVVALWPRALLPVIQDALDRNNCRLMDLLHQHPPRPVEFPLLPGGVDPFFNVNDPDSLREAEYWASRSLIG
ncbi:MAG: molybdenum cofactor guanylyltransferase [Magnetococcales bacterium]|nr:molybdenum cofactor guanylyltransferase [Magnetococcales bacterium]